jgi:hypothetical protein
MEVRHDGSRGITVVCARMYFFIALLMYHQGQLFYAWFGSC